MVYLDKTSHYSLQQLYQVTSISHTRRTNVRLRPGKPNRGSLQMSLPGG